MAYQIINFRFITDNNLDIKNKNGIVQYTSESKAELEHLLQKVANKAITKKKHIAKQTKNMLQCEDEYYTYIFKIIRKK